MKLVVNGQERELGDGASLADLLADLGLAGRRVAVEHNREIVRRDAWQQTTLHGGDVVEIVQFVGGG